MSAYIISTTVIITALGCFVLQVRVSSTLYHMQLKIFYPMHTGVVHSYIGYNFWSKAVLSAKLQKFGVTFIFVWNRYNYTFFFYVHSKLVSWSFPSTLATCSIFSRCWLRNRKRNHTWINICVGYFQGLWWWRTWTKMIRASCNHDHTD